jgi:hypothetical protein
LTKFRATVRKLRGARYESVVVAADQYAMQKILPCALACAASRASKTLFFRYYLQIRHLNRQLAYENVRA